MARPSHSWCEPLGFLSHTAKDIALKSFLLVIIATSYTQRFIYLVSIFTGYFLMLILFYNYIEYLYGSKTVNNEIGYFPHSGACCAHLFASS